jgi:hypothetical protein
MRQKPERAGKSTREMAEKRRQSAFIIGIVGIGIIIAIGFLLQNSQAFGIGGAGILLLLVGLRILPDFLEGRMDKKFKEEKRAIRGAKAEERIGEILADLSEDYCVLHDVKSVYGNIDHVVIGRNSGIYLIETKAHGGEVEVDGETLLVNGKLPEKNFIAQALQNSYWLRDEVGKIVGAKPWITPIVVFTNAFVVSSKPIKGVNIVNKKYLLATLQRTGRKNTLNTQIWDQREKISDQLL